MKTNFRKCNHEQDFLRIRDFLVETFFMFDKPLNWRLERWNYARCFITPLLATDGLGEPDLEAYGEAIRLFDESTGIWESEAGEIVGVINVEHAHEGHPGWGEAFLQRRPDYDFLLDEMLDYAEANLRNQERNLLFIPIYEYDEPLLVVAQKRGYQKNVKYTLWDSVFTVEGEIPQPTLPVGYVLQSMADENDLDRRRKAFGLGFNHPDPNDWPSLLAYQELQKAPDYRQDLDLYVVAPDGEFAAFCIIWWDDHNRIAMLEPVGTVPECRRKGLARAVVLEAIRRAAALGAEKIFVGSDQEFYLSFGFEMKYAGHHWKKEF
jgi:predicted N-acetyltransferase YhbS